jgi:outer membrane lipoprotein SlyB
MNADPTDTRYPHLDLEDLIAGAAGQPIGERAQEHLAGCEHCQLEAKRWNLVADGVRSLAAAAPETAQPARPQRTGQRVLVGPWRRAMLVVGSAAAALILLLGIGIAGGVVHVHLSGRGTGTALTAVTGCSQLEQADGRLERVNGSSLVIKTANGQPVTVTTTATTFVSMSGPLLSDITDGASVMVRGSRSDGTIQAAIVTVGQPFSAVNPRGFVPVQGTVSDASTAGFTLVTSNGTRIPVTTSGDTLVVVPHASPSQLQAGAAIFALGHAGPGGTLTARAVAAISQLPSGPRLGVSVKDCSPRSIDEALGAMSTGSGSAG